MSKKTDDLDLITIHELGKGSQKVQDLIRDKNIEIYDIELKQTITFKKYDPAPKPKGDVRFIKRHTKEQYSLEEMKQKIERVESKYADQIKLIMEENAARINLDHILPTLKEMDKNDLPFLIEKGVNAYKEKQVEKKEALEQALEFNLDDMSKLDEYPIYYDFDDNSKDIDLDKIPDPSDDFE